MKSNKKKDFLAELRRIPIVQVACEKVSLSRNTVYRWRKEDEQFAQDMTSALAEGEELVNDMSESQLLAMIKDKNWAAISFWLRHRNPRFRERLEVTTKIEKPQEALTPEQQEIVAEALRLASLPVQSDKENVKPNQIISHEKSSTESGRPDVPQP